MTTPKLLTVAAIALLAAACSLSSVRAQQREDNDWSGLSHQPDETEVLEQERAAGIAPSQQQENAVNNDIEDIYQALMSQTDRIIPDPKQPADR